MTACHGVATGEAGWTVDREQRTEKKEANGWKWCCATFGRNWVSLTAKCTKMVTKLIYYQNQDVSSKVERPSTRVRIGLIRPCRHLNQKHDPFPVPFPVL